MKGLYTILLLICSNIFMTFAWYGHLKLQETKISTHWAPDRGDSVFMGHCLF